MSFNQYVFDIMFTGGQQNNRNEKLTFNKFAAIRDMRDLFVPQLRDNYILSEYITMDENQLLFLGRCAFRMHLLTKPNLIILV